MYRGPRSVSRPVTPRRLTSGRTIQNFVPCVATPSACGVSVATTSTRERSLETSTRLTSPTRTPRSERVAWLYAVTLIEPDSDGWASLGLCAPGDDDEQREGGERDEPGGGSPGRWVARWDDACGGDGVCRENVGGECRICVWVWLCVLVLHGVLLLIVNAVSAFWLVFPDGFRVEGC